MNSSSPPHKVSVPYLDDDEDAYDDDWLVRIQDDEGDTKVKYGFKSEQTHGARLISKYAVAHAMLKLLGYSPPDTDIPGKYQGSSSTNEFLTNNFPDEPDLQMHFQETPMSYLAMHAKSNEITSQHKIIEFLGKKILRHMVVWKNTQKF